MRFKSIVLGLVVYGLTGCSSGEVPATAIPVIDRFLAAAASGDSVAVAQLTTNVDSVRRILALNRQEPLLLTALRMNRELRSAVTKGDSTFVAFRVLVSTGTETAAIGLVRTPSGAWQVYYFGIPSRG